MMRKTHSLKLLLGLFWICAVGHSAAQTSVGSHVGYDEGRAAFTIQAGELDCAYRALGIYVLPQDTLQIAIAPADRHGSYRVISAAGRLAPLAEYTWQWYAPRGPGVFRVTIRRDAPADSIVLNVFVMVPASAVKNGHLGEYQIGEYPQKPYKGLDNYIPPRGFIKVTRENQQTLLSPHFRLEQFLCKQEGDFPKYVVLREELLLKLELILHELNSRGYRCTGFNILSGYRTPYYNKLIGNVKYSRHQWGGAADIFIDENPADDMMDDLNQDGTINWRDAAVLYDIIDDLYGKPTYEQFIGGLGRYRKTDNHGPFVHVDVRGFRARWGE